MLYVFPPLVVSWKPRQQRSPLPSSSLPWLPPEIHSNIINKIPLGGQNLPRYASVCKTWQLLVERRTLASLSLAVDDLKQFEVMFCNNAQRRRALRYLRFVIPVSSNNDASGIFTRSIVLLLGVLRSLDPDAASDCSHGGLTLEFCTPSQNNPKPARRAITVIPGNQYKGDELLIQQRDCLNIDDSVAPFGLPLVGIVTNLWVLHQNYRRISLQALTLLCTVLPRLRGIRFELWRAGSQNVRHVQEQGMCRAFRKEQLVKYMASRL